MTAEQLTLDEGDCEPAWTTDDALVVLHGHIPHQWWDLKRQGITAWQIHTMKTINVQGDYL